MADTYTGERFILNYQDYCALPNDGRRHAILDAELVVSPSPKTRHQPALLNLCRIIEQHVRTGTLGRVFVAPLDVILHDSSVVPPDLNYVSDENLDFVGEDNIRGIPDLLVEVLSPTNPELDLRDKRQLYARHGVAWYWIVDPYEKTMLELERSADTEREESRPSGNATFTPTLFADMSIPLVEVWS
jgi:Uma2 family endonuclease